MIGGLTLPGNSVRPKRGAGPSRKPAALPPNPSPGIFLRFYGPDRADLEPQ